jgi:histidinol-phosphate aminotransferase
MIFKFGGNMASSGKSTRRRFVGALVASAGYAGSAAGGFGFQNRGQAQPGAKTPPPGPVDYDAIAKLGFNENNYGPSEVVLKAMNDAWKYANRYVYPQGGLMEAIAEHHGVKTENIILGSGSGEVLKAANDAFIPDHRKVVGVDPTFESVYRYASRSNAQSLTVQLRKDYSTDIDGIIKITRQNARDVGLIYICNPNNPTGNIVPKQEIRRLLDGIPEDITVLIDEAYHHFVDNPDYESSVKYVLEGRRVLVARTFSKIAGLAGMRLGYGIASRDITSRMSTVTYDMGLNALVKHGAAAALKDREGEMRIRTLNRQLRDQTTAELKSMGYELIPSDANFFMVNTRRDVTLVGEEFRKRGILVARKFPPMNEWMRVSIGTAEEMRRFMAAFREIFT